LASTQQGQAELDQHWKRTLFAPRMGHAEAGAVRCSSLVEWPVYPLSWGALCWRQRPSAIGRRRATGSTPSSTVWRNAQAPQELQRHDPAADGGKRL